MCHQCHYDPKRVFQINHKESLFIINGFFMCKSLCDKTSFLPLRTAFWIPLIGLKFLFNTNEFRTLWQWEKIPNVIVIYGLYHFIHGIDPPLRVRTYHCLMKFDQIIIHHSNVNLMSLKRYNIIIWYCISIFLSWISWMTYVLEV